MKVFNLQAEAREEQGKMAEKVRRDKKIPGVLYGHGIDNVNLSVNYRDFEIVYNEAGTSSLLDLGIGKSKPVKVLIQDIQRDPVSDDFIHIDFRQVKMTEKIRTEIVVKYVGESKAVKENGGILVKNLNSIKIECLPEDLVHEIEVDISTLVSFDVMIRIKDLAWPKGITALEKENTVVANVQPPRTEEELKSLEEAVEEKVDDVEKSEKEKTDEDAEGEEGKEEEKEDTKDTKKEEKKE